MQRRWGGPGGARAAQGDLAPALGREHLAKPIGARRLRRSEVDHEPGGAQDRIAGVFLGRRPQQGLGMRVAVREPGPGHDARQRRQVGELAFPLPPAALGDARRPAQQQAGVAAKRSGELLGVLQGEERETPPDVAPVLTVDQQGIVQGARLGDHDPRLAPRYPRATRQPQSRTGPGVLQRLLHPQRAGGVGDDDQ